MFPTTFHENAENPDHTHMSRTQYIILAVVLAAIVLAILFFPIGGSLF